MELVIAVVLFLGVGVLIARAFPNTGPQAYDEADRRSFDDAVWGHDRRRP